MEKSNSRARRNGNGPDKGLTKINQTDAELPGSSPGAGPSGADGSPLTPGQAAKQRIEMAVGAGNGEAGSPRGLQDTFLDERNDVLAVINELEDQLDRQQEIRETVERDLTSTSEQLQSANQRAQELEWQVVTLQTRVDALEQLRHDVASLEEELSDANSRAQRANEQLVTSDKERIRLKNELKGVNKQVDELWSVRKERDGLRSDHKVLSARVEELERTQREISEDRATLQSQLQEAQMSLEDTCTERNQLMITLRSTEDRIRELTQVQDTLEEKIDALRAEKKNLQVQITHLERENTRLVDQRQFYECEVTTLRNQSRAAESALASVKKAFGEVRVALNETKSRARRRTQDSWPRVGTPLRGVPDADGGDDMSSSVADEDQIVARADAPISEAISPITTVPGVEAHSAITESVG
jgi:predicted  nucleic acid-binding Zn-ribbon protein